MSNGKRFQVRGPAEWFAFNLREYFKLLSITVVPVFVLGVPADEINAQPRVQSAETGAGGGLVASANYAAETVTGGAIGGGVSSVTPTGGVFANLGYTGQLFDVKSMTISASPGSSLAEGNASQLTALMTMDDETTLTTREVRWSVLSGPATVDSGGLLVARSVVANGTAVAEGSRDGISGTLELTIFNSPYQARPLTWTDPTVGGNGPYKVWMGKAPSALVEIGQSDVMHFNPGLLDMGATYYYRIFDASGTDITPGGNGSDPMSFMTSLFQPDLRIGTKSNPGTHRGNNVYNLSGAGQIAAITIKGRRPGFLHFSVENDGDSTDGHVIRASKGSKKLGAVSYFVASRERANVTAMVTRGGYMRANVSPSESVAYQVQAKAGGKKRAAQALRIGATSLNDGRGADSVTGTVKAVVGEK